MRSPGWSCPRSAKGRPAVERRPAITAFPFVPGRAVPGMIPGPFNRSVAVVPCTTTCWRCRAGMSSTAAGRPFGGTAPLSAAAPAGVWIVLRRATWWRAAWNPLKRYV